MQTCPPCNHNCNQGRACPARVPAGYTAAELERDSPYNQWLHEDADPEEEETPEQRQAMWVAATIERPSQENCYLRGVIDGERAAGAQPVPTLSKEAIRACGGIVHSDGNVFFTSIDQLNATLESAKEMK